MSTSSDLTPSECADAIDDLAALLESGDRSLQMHNLIGRIAVSLTATAARNVRGVALLNRLGVVLMRADRKPRHMLPESSHGRMAPFDLVADTAALRLLAHDLREP